MSRRLPAPPAGARRVLRCARPHGTRETIHRPLASTQAVAMLGRRFGERARDVRPLSDGRRRHISFGTSRKGLRPLSL
jgi:hypothetical protein